MDDKTLIIKIVALTIMPFVNALLLFWGGYLLFPTWMKKQVPFSWGKVFGLGILLTALTHIVGDFAGIIKSSKPVSFSQDHFKA